MSDVESAHFDPHLIERLRFEYHTVAPRAERFAEQLEQQFVKLLNDKGISLSVPIQRRVKTFDSLQEKLQRRGTTIASVNELKDLVGMRIIVQFKKDVPVVQEMMRSNFKILEEEDAASRLKEGEFGYQSWHVIIQLKESWVEIPTMADMGNLKAEVQVRTTAQHIWAAASHTLQYKQEHAVPTPVRRTIHRVSALLETVDLEFDRVLEERERYRSMVPGANDEQLNVDALERLILEWPSGVLLGDSKNYAQALDELLLNKINTIQHFKEIVSRHKNEVIKYAKESHSEFAPYGLVMALLELERGGDLNRVFGR